MDFSELMTSLQQTLGAHLPGILGAIAILAGGWILAVIARAASRRLLSALNVNQRIRESTDQTMDVERGISLGVFWMVLLITAIGVFNALNLELISNPFQVLANDIFGYLPRLISGTVLLLLAWLLATVLRSVATRLLASTPLDERLASEAGMAPLSRNVGNVLFWLVILLFIPAILGAYDLQGLLAPVQNMVDTVLTALPNIFAALLIGFVGWLVARIMRGLVTNLLATAGADRAAHTAGLDESVRVSRITGTLVFILIFVPTLIAALDALKIEAISRPASEMLAKVLEAIPHIVAATLIVVLTYYVAKFASSLVTRLLASLGVDAFPKKLGLGEAFSGGFALSSLTGKLIMFFAMLFAVVEAADQLGFAQVRDLVTSFIRFGGDVLLGGVILLVGFWIAGIAHDAVSRTGNGRGSLLAGVVRFAILGLVIAMGLRSMGIADDIVNLAFGLTLGAIAVAVALSFGLGGREAAGRQMEHWLSRMRGKD